MERVGHGEDIDAVDRFEHVEVFFELRFDAVRNACIGDHERRASRTAFEFTGGRKYFLTIGDVGRQNKVALQAAVQRVCKLFKTISASGHKAHRSAAGRVGARKRSANAARSAGDENIEHRKTSG